MNIIRFLILNDEEIFIYSPEYYRKINLVRFKTVNLFSNSKYTDANISDYPYCIYDYLINDSFQNSKKLLSLLTIKIFLSGFFIQFHMKKGSNEKSILCVEIDFSSFVNSIRLNDNYILIISKFFISYLK